MAEPSTHINLAKAFGFHSEAAAIVFAIIYFPLCVWFTVKCFVHPTYVHFIMNLFCQIRLAAFILRAILIKVDSVGDQLKPLIADEILFGIGFFSLLYSGYILVLDIEIKQNRPQSTNPLVRLTKNRHIFRLTLMLAVALGVIASTSAKNDGTLSGTALTERKVSSILFLVLTILQASQTLFLVQMELRDPREKRADEPFGARHAMTILLATSLLLIVREAFSVATMTNVLKQNNEHFWYPLMAVPEVLVMILFSIPGLVPRKGDRDQTYTKEQSGSSTSL